MCGTFCSKNLTNLFFVSYDTGEVPTKWKRNKSLGRWVSTQRSEYKKFQNGEIVNCGDEEMEKRIYLLTELGFTWTYVP